MLFRFGMKKRPRPSVPGGLPFPARNRPKYRRSLYVLMERGEGGFAHGCNERTTVIDGCRMRATAAEDAEP
ncbi:hypothetical protein SD70_21855 [Gordoniibacillus kamchatkensis]|uniref:Uncharacterized protein n=1 Tax=Gordoniibacillus kamchatkensis TaxID=1590651 RepID=A0ABR5ADU1_9BACL|nr:hypothetical protein SD70_21855 [Paenibacillus sp. VKM B-2647]